MDKQLITDLESVLRELSVSVLQREREILNQFSLTSPQYSVLLLLAQHEHMTIGELSQKCCLACSTMTDLVDRMEKKQLVERVQDEQDRRVTHIRLLAYGETLISAVMKKRQQDVASIFIHLSEEEAISIKQQLKLVCEKIKELKM